MFPSGQHVGGVAGTCRLPARDLGGCVLSRRSIRVRDIHRTRLKPRPDIPTGNPLFCSQILVAYVRDKVIVSAAALGLHHVRWVILRDGFLSASITRNGGGKSTGKQ